MAEGHTLKSSVIIDDYLAYPQSNNNEEEHLTSRAVNLIYSEKEFSWEGSLDELKSLVKYDVQLQGKRTSPGGQVKLFTSCNYI
jgi:hypothetical protein